MRRAGGIVLGVVAVLAMAAGGWYALRPVFQRETATVLFVGTGTRPPTDEAIWRGANFAVHEAGDRAGRFKVRLVRGPILTSPDIHVVAYVTTSEPVSNFPAPDFVALDPEPPLRFSFYAAPGLTRQARAAVDWVRRSNLGRVILVRDAPTCSLEIAHAFESAARDRTLAVEGPFALGAGRSGVIARILESRPDLVFYSGEEAPYATGYEIFSELREKGFTGKLLMADADPGVSFLVAPDRLVEGTLLVSPFAPPPKEFADGYRAWSGLRAGTHAYYGYFAMKAAMEALSRADSLDLDLIKRAGTQLPYFDAQGATTVHSCALYVARNGHFEFVELLK